MHYLSINLIQMKIVAQQNKNKSQIGLKKLQKKNQMEFLLQKFTCEISAFKNKNSFTFLRQILRKVKWWNKQSFKCTNTQSTRLNINLNFKIIPSTKKNNTKFSQI